MAIDRDVPHIPAAWHPRAALASLGPRADAGRRLAQLWQRAGEASGHRGGGVPEWRAFDPLDARGALADFTIWRLDAAGIPTATMVGTRVAAAHGVDFTGHAVTALFDDAEEAAAVLADAAAIARTGACLVSRAVLRHTDGFAQACELVTVPFRGENGAVAHLVSACTREAGATLAAGGGSAVTRRRFFAD